MFTAPHVAEQIAGREPRLSWMPAFHYTFDLQRRQQSGEANCTLRLLRKQQMRRFAELPYESGARTRRYWRRDRGVLWTMMARTKCAVDGSAAMPRI
jgi:hypothetical protein